MITLKLKVSYLHGAQGQFMSVTSDMLEVVPSPGGVSRFVHANSSHILFKASIRSVIAQPTPPVPAFVHPYVIAC